MNWKEFIIIPWFFNFYFSCTNPAASPVQETAASEMQPLAPLHVWLHLPGRARPRVLQGWENTGQCRHFLSCAMRFLESNGGLQAPVDVFADRSAMPKAASGVTGHPRPSRGARARMETAPCGQEIHIRDMRGQPVHTIRILSCDGGRVRLDPGAETFLPGPAGELMNAAVEELRPGGVRTWLWKSGGVRWAVSLGILHVDDARVVFRREGPAPEALFAPADTLGLRDGRVDIHLQAQFLLGSMRALFTVADQDAGGHLVLEIRELAELEEALAYSPGSWAPAWRERFAGEVLAFARRMHARGRRVTLSGEKSVVPAVRRVDPSVFEVGAEHVRTRDNGVELLTAHPDGRLRAKLDLALVQAGLFPGQVAWVHSRPDGWWVELPPGWKAASCRGKTICLPPLEESARLGAFWSDFWTASFPDPAHALD